MKSLTRVREILIPLFLVFTTLSGGIPTNASRDDATGLNFEGKNKFAIFNY